MNNRMIILTLLKHFQYFQRNIVTSVHIIWVQSAVDFSLHTSDVIHPKMFKIRILVLFRPLVLFF